MKKIFVLDTSVILFDHNSIYNLEDNDVVIPITVLEEVDMFKKGNEPINFEAREFIRQLDSLSEGNQLNDWVQLKPKAKGRLKVQMNKPVEPDACKVFGDKNDHKILNVAVLATQEYKDASVIMVSKDINLRLKAKSLDVIAADYETGKVKNVDDLYKGKAEINGVPSEVIDKIYQEGQCPASETGIEKLIPNHYFILKNGKSSVLCVYNAEDDTVDRVEKRTAYGIKPKNAEQVFALHAILNEKVKLVTIQGVAGTGKTLLALSGSLEQKRNHKQIYLARPIVPLSNKDIGYLPGDIKSKLNPYMEPLWDNLKFIQNQYKETDKDYKKIDELIESEKLSITPLAYIRGRSLSNICFIIDEAQNLTPHEIKTIITRAGENTKIIFTGDIYQIDTPYLDTQSNGLSYLIDKIQGHPLAAHVTLEKGERSELANLANDLL